MEFYHNYSKCSVCGSKMIEYKIYNYFDDEFDLNCPNKCCFHKINIKSESSLTYFFDLENASYLLPLYKSTFENKGIYVKKIYLEDYSEFIKQIKYWKENERYLMKLLTR